MKKKIETKALEQAIKVAGSPTMLARLLKTTKQAVHGWQLAGSVPYRKAAQVETLTGVSRFHLQTDIRPPPGDDWKVELEEIRASIVKEKSAEASALWGD